MTEFIALGQLAPGSDPHSPAVAEAALGKLQSASALVIAAIGHSNTPLASPAIYPLENVKR
jgi:hypothetical protein